MVRTPRVSLLLLCTQRARSLALSLVRKNRSCLVPVRLLMASPRPETGFGEGFWETVSRRAASLVLFC
jgi:hypothetical protein